MDTSTLAVVEDMYTHQYKQNPFLVLSKNKIRFLETRMTLLLPTDLRKFTFFFSPKSYKYLSLMTAKRCIFSSLALEIFPSWVQFLNIMSLALGHLSFYSLHWTHCCKAKKEVPWNLVFQPGSGKHQVLLTIESHLSKNSNKISINVTHKGRY